MTELTKSFVVLTNLPAPLVKLLTEKVNFAGKEVKAETEKVNEMSGATSRFAPGLSRWHQFC